MMHSRSHGLPLPGRVEAAAEPPVLGRQQGSLGRGPLLATGAAARAAAAAVQQSVCIAAGGERTSCRMAGWTCWVRQTVMLWAWRGLGKAGNSMHVTGGCRQAGNCTHAWLAPAPYAMPPVLTALCAAPAMPSILAALVCRPFRPPSDSQGGFDFSQDEYESEGLATSYSREDGSGSEGEDSGSEGAENGPLRPPAGRQAGSAAAERAARHAGGS